MNLKVYPVGTVLSACSAASVGAVAITTVRCCTNQTFIGLVAGNKLNNVYLYYYMYGIKDYLKGLGTGATIAYVSQDK
jgi:type I restriction enzyme S subunit